MNLNFLKESMIIAVEFSISKENTLISGFDCVMLPTERPRKQVSLDYHGQIIGDTLYQSIWRNLELHSTLGELFRFEDICNKHELASGC